MEGVDDTDKHKFAGVSVSNSWLEWVCVKRGEKTEALRWGFLSKRLQFQDIYWFISHNNRFQQENHMINPINVEKNLIWQMSIQVLFLINSIQAFQSCYCCHSVATLCLTLQDFMDRLPVFHYLPEFAQIHVHWVNDAIQPSHPLSPSFFSCP